MTSPDSTIGNRMQQLASLAGGLIVSCQARPGNPLHGPETMALMARAAELGGARGLRVNGPADIRAVMQVTSLPVLAINKVDYDDSPVMITPTIGDAEAILDTGAPLIALDGTNRHRPNGETLAGIIEVIHRRGALAFADLATQDDLQGAIDAGADAVGTTLSGYTRESASDSPDPDLELLAWLVKYSPVPVFAEGRFWTPEQATEALRIGASFVVVGTAITNPMAITSRFVASLDASRSNAS
ncbi:MAG TPA: N-acetylmannosamine-6-phosphate 2-epimerase [Thermomicrobiales bacterium]|nr:N-acetylmannosamine-6-phosphate 2-epimerase [Thermomicrobiales bacterium]